MDERLVAMELDPNNNMILVYGLTSPMMHSCWTGAPVFSHKFSHNLIQNVVS